MNSLNLGEEYSEFTINGDETRVIKIDLNDYAIITRLNESYKRIEDFANKNSADVNSDGTAKDTLSETAEVIGNFDKFIKEQIDYIFNSKVSDIVFGEKSPLSMVKGIPLYQRFLTALQPYMEEIVKRERKASEKRMDKYLKVIKK